MLKILLNFLFSIYWIKWKLLGLISMMNLCVYQAKTSYSAVLKEAWDIHNWNAYNLGLYRNIICIMLWTKSPSLCVLAWPTWKTYWISFSCTLHDIFISKFDFDHGFLHLRLILGLIKTHKNHLETKHLCQSLFFFFWAVNKDILLTVKCFLYVGL